MATTTVCEWCEKNPREVWVSFARLGTGVLLDKREVCWACAGDHAKRLSMDIGARREDVARAIELQQKNASRR